MKKALPIILAVIAVIAVVFGIVANVNGGNVKKTLETEKAALEQQLNTLKADSESAAAAASEELATAQAQVADLTKQVEEMTAQAANDAAAAQEAKEKAVEEAKTAAAAELENAITEAKTAAAAELENAVTEAKTAAAAELENAVTEAKTAAAAELENAVTEAKTAAAAVLEESQAQAAALQTQVEDLTAQAAAAAEAAAENLSTAVADAKAEAEAKAAEALDTAKTAAAAELEAVKTAAAAELEAAQAQAATLQTQVDELTAQAATLQTQVEDLTAQAAAAAETAATNLTTAVAEAKAVATAELESAVEEAKAAAATELEEAKAQAAALQTKVDELQAAMSSDNTKEELAAAMQKADELQAQVDDLTAKLAKAERAVIAAQSNAYVMYANTDWSLQNWGTADSEDGLVTVNPAQVVGPGEYAVSLEFAKPAEGLAFAAIGINNGEKLFPNYYIDITSIYVNGEPIAFTKGYTSSDDGIVTRVNIYNEWVAELPADARRLDGDLTDAAAIIVNKEDFASVNSIEVCFSFSPAQAYLMYADAAWANQNWGYASTDTVTVTPAVIAGEGEYTVGLEFAEPAEGLAFAALGIKNGEKDFPNWVFDVTKVEVNGTEVELGKDYTSSDDGKETRSNIYNEWVAELPVDARSVDDLAECTPKAVDPAVFTGVKSVLVTFNAVYRAPVAEAAEETGMSKEDADLLKSAGFHAYIGVQGKDTYVFRNAWNDAYGLNDAENPFFDRLTGWDADGNAEDYGGSFADTGISSDGNYAVGLTTGEKGFGDTQAFNLLFVSTDIPSDLYNAGYLTISDVKTAIGNAAEKDYYEIDASGDYVMIKVLDSYNQASEPFGYTVPGANEDITISFTVSNW